MALPAVPTILIVDDYPEIRRLLRRALEEKYTCLEASSASEARNELATKSVDLVLLDLELGDASGLAWLADGSLHASGGVVISMSGDIDPSTPRAALRLGAADHVQKPFSLENLYARIARALGSCRRHLPALVSAAPA